MRPASQQADQDRPARDLERMFRSRSAVLIGASQKSAWSHFIFNAIRDSGFSGPMYAVNKRGDEAHGLLGFTSCAGLPEPVDVAYIYVPTDGVIGAMEDAAAAGIRECVVLSSGFSEAGPEGAVIEAQLVRRAEELGVQFLGPNSLGYANYAIGSAVTAIPPRLPLLAGGIGLVSQSGATAYEFLLFAHLQNVGLSFFCATGNEAAIDVAALVDHLVDDDSTHVIAVFCEAIRDPQTFLSAARRALEKKKPIVILKVGASEISAEVAKAHTGSMVGDDRVFDAACRQFGVIRVNSLEGLIITARVAEHVGLMEKSGVAVVSISGGACTLIADQADKVGMALPAFSEVTKAKLKAELPDYASSLNPFDITGAAVKDPNLFERCIQAIGEDPSIGLILCSFGVPMEEDAPRDGIPSIGRGMCSITQPAILLNQTIKPINTISRRIIAECGIKCALGGIQHVTEAIAKLWWWSERTRRTAPTRLDGMAVASKARPTSERAVLAFLAEKGIPVIPAEVVLSADAACAAAARMGDPVVLKILSKDILHKSDIGAVKLNLTGSDQVAAAYGSIVASAAAACPKAEIEGVIVSPMRSGGTEIFVGVARDPQWGPVLAVGLGGIWVEILDDTVLQLLPVRSSDVVAMLKGLRGIKALTGARGSMPVDIEALSKVIADIGNAALDLGPDLAALEINPLLATGDRIEALDGVAIWADHVA